MTPCYRLPLLYRAMMLCLYRQNYWARHRTIADLIPEGSTVLDVCCGPGTLYTRYLRNRRVAYKGLDLSESFVKHLRSIGADAELWDGSDSRPLPTADIVVMQGSLCHFHPEVLPVLRRMMRAARRNVIISEPIRSVMHGEHRWLAAIAARVTNPGNGRSDFRFTPQQLDDSIADCHAQVESRFLIPGGREYVYVLRA